MLQFSFSLAQPKPSTAIAATPCSNDVSTNAYQSALLKADRSTASPVGEPKAARRSIRRVSEEEVIINNVTKTQAHLKRFPRGVCFKRIYLGHE